MGTLVKPTTKTKRRSSGSNVDIANLKRRSSGAWTGLTFLKRRLSGGWVWIYSTPDVTATGGAANSDSGASASGTVTRQVFATPGGVDSGSRSFSWVWQSGDAGIVFNSGSVLTDQNPTLKQDFTGVANGGSSTGGTAVYRVTQTDTVTGAQVYSDVTVGPFTWNNTIPAFTPHADDFFSGSGATITVPAGAVQLVLEVWGNGGGGGTGATGGNDHQGGGGGAGGYAKSIIALSGDAGKTLTYTVGSPSTVSGSLTNGGANITANGGNGGFTATPTTNGAGNTGGTATGGNTTNATGASGIAGNTGGTTGQGGAANNGYAAGGQGGYANTNIGRNIGLQGGRVRFTWT